jgi:ketosteroid isomerase-like protein
MTAAETLAGLYAAFAEGDVPTVLGAMDPQIHWHEAEGNPYMPSGEPWVGPDAIVSNLFMKLAEEWDGFAVHPAIYHDAGGSVVVEGRYSGTYKGTGNSLDTQFCHVWSLADGKITKFQQYVDTGAMQEAMGAQG